LSLSFLDRWLGEVGPSTAITILADLMDDAAVLAVDRESRIVLWSSGAERLLGYPADRVVGRLRQEAVPDWKCNSAERMTESVSICDQPVEVTNAGGDAVRMRRWVQVLTDAESRFVGAIEVLSPDAHAGEMVADFADEHSSETFHGLITRDPAMKHAFLIIRNVGETGATVLIRGESGTGKELVARAIHAESPRRGKPFLAINCAALTTHLLESELFGHVRGAFTGAVRDHIGVFQRADGGTLFLDEVAELPLELQAKLLRVLQDRTFLPVGGDNIVTVDVRIVAATHRSLREEVKARRFREDLMYRLRVVPIFLPPLRERGPDIPLLLWDFIARQNRTGPRRIDRIAPQVMRKLLDYHWPGNIRELQNLVEYVFAVGRGAELTLAELPPEFLEDRFASPRGAATSLLKKALRDEPDRIREALELSKGQIEKAAELLGVSRATFWRKRRKYNL